MKVKNKIFYFFVGLMTISCAGPYTEKDNGSTIELSEDDPFEVKLEGEANSDFSWRLVSKNENIEMQGAPTLTVSGANNEYTFNFIAKGYGDDLVRLDYSNGTKIEKTYELRVIVGTMGRITSE